MICADPELATADKELTGQVVGLFKKLREDEVKGALAEYARWTRTRDRICDLVTGTCWDLQARQPKAMAANSRENVSVGYHLTVEKSFVFQKAKDGSWRCNTETLRPVEYGTAQRGP